MEKTKGSQSFLECQPPRKKGMASRFLHPSPILKLPVDVLLAFS
jgi:hypothetical protein